MVGAWTGNGDDPDPAGDEVFNVAATATPTATATRTPVPATETATPSATASPTETPTPTPTPYAGAVDRLQIPRFNVDSDIEAIGLIPGTNQLDTPHDPHNTGWYEIYDRPGWRGNAVFSAHVDYFPNIRGPFYNLARMELDDEVVVVMDNGERYTYEVIRKQRYTVSGIPMGDIIWPDDRPEGEEWITLITCGGEFRATSPSGAGEYLHRDVVVARRVAE
ncbi:MAG: class F sortase [Dehalococcoidia bacterium]|nr:class F sortase [Dehalococcoidia bacterium]